VLAKRAALHANNPVPFRHRRALPGSPPPTHCLLVLAEHSGHLGHRNDVVIATPGGLEAPNEERYVCDVAAGRQQVHRVQDIFSDADLRIGASYTSPASSTTRLGRPATIVVVATW